MSKQRAEQLLIAGGYLPISGVPEWSQDTRPGFAMSYWSRGDDCFLAVIGGDEELHLWSNEKSVVLK
jgi:hypothetical protein